MSAAPTPEPAGLSDSQRRVLDDLAARENASDPGFVLRMNAPARRGRVVPDAAGPDAALPDAARAETVEATVTRGRRRDRLVQLAVLGAIVALVLPVTWTLALVLTAALVVGPTWLLVTALRAGGFERPSSPSDDPPAGPGRP